MIPTVRAPAAARSNILLVVRWPVGGIRTYLRYIYQRYDWSAYDFTIVAPAQDEMRVLLADLNSVEPSYIPLPAKCTTGTFARSVFGIIMRGHFSLVHSHGLTATLSAAPGCILRGIPHIATSHDMFNSEHFSGVKGRIKRAIVGSILSRADVVHCISNAARDNVMEYLPVFSHRREMLAVIRSGIDVPRFLDGEARDFRKELDLSADDFLIGFLGRFMSLKGFRCLVDAVGLLAKRSDLPCRPLVLAFGWGGFIREDQSYIREKGLDAYFRFLPFTADVAPSLRGLDLLTMPSLSETCPLLAMEALVTGVPVIASDIPALKEILEGTPGVLVRKADASALASAIFEKMRNPGRDDSARYAAEAAKRFDMRNTAEGLDAVYTRLISS